MTCIKQELLQETKINELCLTGWLHNDNVIYAEWAKILEECFKAHINYHFETWHMKHSNCQVLLR